MTLGIAGVILVFAMFFLELQTMYDYQYAIEVRAQRAINSCVEYAMDDDWRADGQNRMDVTVAQNMLYTFLREDLNLDSQNRCYDSNGALLYRVVFGTPTYSDGASGTPAGIEMDITVTMFAGISKRYGMDGHTWTNHYSSTNFRID